MVTHQVGVLVLVGDVDIVEFQVEKLIDALKGAANRDIVLQLDRDLLVDEGLEEAGVKVSAASL